MLEIIEIPIGKITVGEHEQRLEIDDEDIDGLAVSIGRLGVLQPLIVKPQGDTFSLVAGHRRLLAAKHVGLSTVPCLVASGSKDLDVEKSFAENFFRKDLSPVELAGALKDCLLKKTMTVEELAAGFHRSTHWVGSMLAIADWPEDIQQAIHYEQISVSAASNLACVTDERYRIFLLRNAVEQGATARTTAAWLQAFRSVQPPEQAIQAEPVAGVAPSAPLIPQAPCLCCSHIYPVNQMSHVPMCPQCVQVIRQVGASGGGQSMPPTQQA